MISLFETPKKEELKSVGLISSFESLGHSGVLLDGKSVASLKLAPLSVLSAVDVYRKDGSFSRHEIPSPVFSAELDVLFGQQIHALKIGTLGLDEHVEALTEKIDGTDFPIVFDLSFLSKKGEERNTDRVLELAFDRLTKLSTLLVLNHQEAQHLARFSVFEPASMRNAAKTIYERFGVHTLITGGHLDRVTRDIYYDGSGAAEFGADRISENIVGTGSAYSALISALLVSTTSVGDAIAEARERLTIAMKEAREVNGISVVYF